MSKNKGKEVGKKRSKDEKISLCFTESSILYEIASIYLICAFYGFKVMSAVKFNDVFVSLDITQVIKTKTSGMNQMNQMKLLLCYRAD